MAMKYKAFLTKFFEQRHFDKMPAAVRARFNDYLKQNDLAGDMKYWRDNLLIRKPSGEYQNADLPSTSDMINSEWANLFVALQAAFQNMSFYTDNFADNKKATDFLNKYFGPGKLFEPTEASPTAKIACTELAKLLEDPTHTEQRRIVNALLQDVNDGELDLQNFIDGLHAKQYDTDPKFYKTLKNVLNHIPFDAYPLFDTVDVDEILTGFGNATPTAVDVANLKANYKEILTQIHDQPKISNVFKDYDGGKICGALANARKKVAYDDPESNSFVPEKLPDKKGLFKRVQSAAQKFEENNLDSWGRILTLRGTRRFFSPYSKSVITTLQGIKTKDGKRLKPTDGLKGILDNKDAILGKLSKTSTNGKEHFKWFVKLLEKYSKETPDVFNGALYDSGKMLTLVSNIIYHAIEDNKIDAAKTSMELLSTMKYGLFHSRTVDAMKSIDFDLLSNKGYSWNKFGAVQFTTKAIDTAAKYAMLGVARGVTAVRNGHSLLHMRFNGQTKKNYAFNKAHSDMLKESYEGFSNANGGKDLVKTKEAALKALRKNKHDAAAQADLQLVQNWEQTHPDQYMELMAFWDMLETHWASHKMTFAAEWMRKRFLDPSKNKTARGKSKGMSKAEEKTQEFLAAYMRKYANRQ